MKLRNAARNVTQIGRPEDCVEVHSLPGNSFNTINVLRDDVSVRTTADTRTKYPCFGVSMYRHELG